MRKLTLALFHVEPCVDPVVPGALDAAEMGYALGAVRFLELHPGQKGAVARVRRATNTHFGPVPLLDDLYRPWVDAAVCYDRRSLDLALAAAIWPSPAFHYVNPTDLEATGARLRAAGLPEASLRPCWRVKQGSLGVGPAAQAKEIARRTVGHSKMIPGSLIGLVPGGQALRAELERRTFVVLGALHATTGHPALCALEDWREALSAPAAPGAAAPAPATAGEPFAEAYAAGRVWGATAAVHRSLDQLEEIVHAGVFGGPAASLRTNRVRTDEGWVDAHRVEDPAAMYRYRIPTASWWADLHKIADRG